jgi:fatty acid synthase
VRVCIVGFNVKVDPVLGVCSAGGVQIAGLHATVAPRRQAQNSQPLLERYSFVPYIERSLATHGEPSLLQYLNACTSFVCSKVNQLLENGLTEQLPKVDFLRSQLQQLKMGSKDLDNDDAFNDLCKKPSSVLASLIRDVFDKPHDSVFVQNARNLISSQWNSLQKDDQALAFLTQSGNGALRSCIDLAIENCAGSKVKIAEFKSSLYRQVNALLSLQPTLDVDYSLLNGSAEESDLKQHRVRAALLNDKTQATLGQFGIVVAEDIHSETDLASTLATLSSLVAPQGCLLLSEYTQSLPLLGVVMALGGQLDNVTDGDSRTAGALCSVERWTQLLAQMDFDLIAEKSDGLARSLLLFRKRCSAELSSPSESALVIDTNEADFGWVSEVVECMQGTKAKDCPIWLRAKSCDGTYSGIVGLVNCLRREPGGQRIRCVDDL